MGKSISFQRPDGESVNGYLAEGARSGHAPGIVVIQEWWGLNDQIRGVADKLAAAGYRALVPDLYRGKLALEANEAEHLMKGLNFAVAAGQDVRGAVQHLRSARWMSWRRNCAMRMSHSSSTVTTPSMPSPMRPPTRRTCRS